MLLCLAWSYKLLNVKRRWKESSSSIDIFVHLSRWKSTSKFVSVLIFTRDNLLWYFVEKKRDCFLWIFHFYFWLSLLNVTSNHPQPLHFRWELEKTSDILSLAKCSRENNLQVITLSNNHKSIYFDDDEKEIYYSSCRQNRKAKWHHNFLMKGKWENIRKMFFFHSEIYFVIRKTERGRARDLQEWER